MFQNATGFKDEANDKAVNRLIPEIREHVLKDESIALFFARGIGI